MAPYLSLRDQLKLRITLPELEIQRSVADSLAALDDKIELNRRMNETLEAMAQAIFRDWFVDFGPIRRKMAGKSDPIEIMGGLVQDPTRATELAGLFADQFGDDGLPEGWEERPYTSFVSIVGGGTPKTSVDDYWNGEIPWFSVVDTPVTGSIFVTRTEKSITEKGLTKSSARMIPAGATIISARGTVGNLAMAAQEMTFNQSCYGLLGEGAVGDCFTFLAAQHLVHRLQAMAHGSVFSTITRKTFASLSLARPSDDMFEVFEKLSAPLFDKVKANVIQNQTLAATRDLLLPKLMSGEIRVKDAESVAGGTT